MACDNDMFNFPDPTIDIPKYLPQTFQNKNDCVVVGERRFHLNKSKCKFVTVGLAYDFQYDPCVKLCGTKCDTIIFTQAEWKLFLTYQGIISNYFHSNDVIGPIDIEEFRIEFEKQFSGFIRIVKNNSYVCLGYETMCRLWEYIPIINYRLDMLERLQFKNYFKIVKTGLQRQGGNIFENALNLLRPSENKNSESVSMVMELIYMYPEIFEVECGNKKRV